MTGRPRAVLGGIAALFVLALVAGLSLGVAAPASAADDEASIAHVETTDDGIRVLVNVPPGATVDLDGVTASLDRDDLDATATLAESDTVVRRTAVLVMDTSQSMRKQGRFEAAKDAARTYLDAVPADVQVGIVTFDSEVETALEPTSDRDAARAVIGGLELAKETLLYDGLLAALEVAGDEGQRSLLVLSDGADTGDTALDDVTAAIGEANALVDVVSLGQTGGALDALAEMADAGQGQVIESSGEELAQTFADEAAVLASQVLVTAPLPSGFDAPEATVEVTLPSDAGELVASAFAPIQDAPATEVTAPAIDRPSAGWNAPGWLLYVGVAVFAVGLLASAVLLVPAKPQPMTLAERVTAYSGGSSRIDPDSVKPAADPMLDQAKAAAQGVLTRNKRLEEKLATRLAAAGSGFKPSEWLLLHVGVVVAAGLLGLLVGGGNIVVGLLFLVVGWILAADLPPLQGGAPAQGFNTALPETLQLMSGSLVCGTVPRPVGQHRRQRGPGTHRFGVQAGPGREHGSVFRSRMPSSGVAARFQYQGLRVGGHGDPDPASGRWQPGRAAGHGREQRCVSGSTCVGRSAALAAEGKLSAICCAAFLRGSCLFVLLTNRDPTSAPCSPSRSA